MELKLKKNYNKWLFLVPLSVFILDYFLVISSIIKPIDTFVYQLLHQLISSDFTPVVILITHIGSFMGIVMAICVIFVFSKRIALLCAIASLITQLVNRVIKSVVQRPRPDVIHLVVESNYSFPSGHAMAITCLYGLFIYYLYNSKIKYRKLLISLCIVVIVLVALSRVYLGVHYFSDVFGGIMLSLSLIMYMCNKPSFNA